MYSSHWVLAVFCITASCLQLQRVKVFNLNTSSSPRSFHRGHRHAFSLQPVLMYAVHICRSLRLSERESNAFHVKTAACFLAKLINKILYLIGRSFGCSVVRCKKKTIWKSKWSEWMKFFQFFSLNINYSSLRFHPLYLPWLKRDIYQRLSLYVLSPD